MNSADTSDMKAKGTKYSFECRNKKQSSYISQNYNKSR